MDERIIVVGAGIGDDDAGLLARALRECRVVVARTLRHPRLGERLKAAVEPDVPIIACDDLYDQAKSFAELYARIVDRLVDLARMGGPVGYVVPGSPAVAERSVALLRATEPIPVSVAGEQDLLEAAALAAGVDPIDGMVVADAAQFLSDPSDVPHVLLLQCDHEELARTVVAQLAARGGEAVLLHHLGLGDQLIKVVTEEDPALARADHLTSILGRHLGRAPGDLTRLVGVVRTLRRTCPWDREQTHASLARHLIEEAYETVSAIDELDEEGPSHLIEELGDVLLQVLMHATIAEEEGSFDLGAVAEALEAKLRRRHPHVFGTLKVDDAATVVANWERIKDTERRQRVPEHLPGALRLHKALRTAKGLGIAEPELLARAGADASPLVREAILLIDAGGDPEEVLRRAAASLEVLWTGREQAG
jgi:tetrapyrrole methylase family protein/MazG family protein